MKRFAFLFALALLFVFAAVPETKDGINVQVSRTHGALQDAGSDWIQIFVWTGDSTIVRFRVTVQIQDGSATTTQTQEIARNPVSISLAGFKVPPSAHLTGNVSVERILAPLAFAAQ